MQASKNKKDDWEGWEYDADSGEEPTYMTEHFQKLKEEEVAKTKLDLSQQDMLIKWGLLAGEGADLPQMQGADKLTERVC